MSGKIKSNSCKWLAEHFSKGICKNANYSAQIIEKWQGNVKQFLGGSEEQMLKLRTVYPYGLNVNEKVDTLRSLIDVPPPLIKF